MQHPNFEWQFVRYQAALTRLHRGDQYTRDLLVRSEAQIRTSLEILIVPHRMHLEKLRSQLAECEMIRDLATDPEKREQYTELAEHFKILVAETAKKMADTILAIFLGGKTHSKEF